MVEFWHFDRVAIVSHRRVSERFVIPVISEFWQILLDEDIPGHDVYGKGSDWSDCSLIGQYLSGTDVCLRDTARASGPGQSSTGGCSPRCSAWPWSTGGSPAPAPGTGGSSSLTWRAVIITMMMEIKKKILKSWETLGNHVSFGEAMGKKKTLWIALSNQYETKTSNDVTQIPRKFSWSSIETRLKKLTVLKSRLRISIFLKIKM